MVEVPANAGKVIALQGCEFPAGSEPGEFRALFEANFAYVWSVLRRLGVREEDAEDLAHEAFIAVHRKFADYDSSRPVRPWLFAFAYRVAESQRRKAHHRREVIGLDDGHVSPEPPADEQLASHEAKSILLRALDELDLERRAVIVLHEWDGEPIPAVAKALEIPLNTAYSRLRLARADLAAAVKRMTARHGGTR